MTGRNMQTYSRILTYLTRSKQIKEKYSFSSFQNDSLRQYTSTVPSNDDCKPGSESIHKPKQPPDEEVIDDLSTIAKELYPGHQPTTSLQKALLALGSGVGCLLNPARDDLICALGETTGPAALRYMRGQMLADSTGRRILEEKPLITTETVDLQYLNSLPEGMFGKEYWHFLNRNGFSPDARLPVRFIDDSDLTYIMTRYRQLHDLTHTLMDMPTNLLGEVAVKWFEAVQYRLPMCVSAAVLGPVRLGPKHRQKYLQLYLPWALKAGRQADFLMNVYFEEHWETDIHELRSQLKLEPPPEPLVQTGKGKLSG